MSFPSNFKFLWEQTGETLDVPLISSPVQTISAVTTWCDVNAQNYANVFVQHVSSAYEHKAAIKTDGTLWLWGRPGSGRLGNNDDGTERSSPVQTVSQGTNWCQVSLGAAHSAAIKTDGTLWLWGSAKSGALGTNSLTDVSSPVQTISTGTNWCQVSLGAEHSAAIKTDGTLWLWGRGDSGEMGNSGGSNSNLSPVQTICTGTNWCQVSLGSTFSGAIKTDGTLWMWGEGNNGRLGNNTGGQCKVPVQTIACGNNWRRLSLGTQHVGAVKTDGTLWMWGTGGSGRLGDGTVADKSSPVQVVGNTQNWVQIALGEDHSGGIKTDGTLWTWGQASSGVLGNNATQASDNRCSPAQTVSFGTNWCQIEFGRDSSSAVKSDGTLWVWGTGNNGRLGDNTAASKSSPVQTISATTNWCNVVNGNECGFLTSISASLNFSAAVKSDGTLWLWGVNNCGQLGNNSTIDVSSPVQTVSTGTNWKQVSLGVVHSAAIKSDGTLWIWGRNDKRQLGDNTSAEKSSPVQTVATGNNWKQLSLGCEHSSAIKTDGTLWLWGTNAKGQIGDGATSAQSSPVQTISSGTNWKQVSLGSFHSAAIKTDGTLWLWGENSGGQAAGILGNNATTDLCSPVQTVSTGTNWKQVSLGVIHSAAIKTDGTLWLWGNGICGALGTNSTTARSSPVQTVSNVTTWKQVSLGQCHSAAVKIDGTLWLWGEGVCGKLGNNNTINVSSPVQTICTGLSWQIVSAGSCHNLALRSNCQLWVWGDNTIGALGRDLTCGIIVTINADFDDVFVRRDIFSQGGLWGWGGNSNGQLGNNAIADRSSPVQTIAGGANWRQVSFSCSATGAVKTDGTLWLWGDNNKGQLGNNLEVNRSSPLQTISSGKNWKQVSLGGETSAAIKTDGTLWLWGFANNGQLGDNTTAKKSSPVQTISATANWKQVSLGDTHVSSIKTDGTLWLWGNAAGGTLGNNSTINASSPVQTVSTGTNWKQVSLGREHSAAVKTDGTLWLWGNGGAGKLGNNSSTNCSSPVQTVSTGTNWKQVSAGDCHSAAIKTDGTLWLWGINGQGQLGNNNLIGTNRSSPVQTVSTGTNWKQVSLGGQHSAAIKTDGTLWLWGYNGNGDAGEPELGALGNNSTLSVSSPVQTVSTGTNWIDISLRNFNSFGIREDCY